MGKELVPFASVRKLYEAPLIFPVFWADPKRLLLWRSESHRKCSCLIFLGLILHFAETRFWTHSQQVARPGCEPSFTESAWAAFKARNPQVLPASSRFVFLLKQSDWDRLVSESLSFLILLHSLVVFIPYGYHVCVWVTLVVSDSLKPHGLQPARLLCPWDSPGKNTAVGGHALLQGLNPHLMSAALAGGFFTTSATWEEPRCHLRWC